MTSCFCLNYFLLELYFNVTLSNQISNRKSFEVFSKKDRFLKFIETENSLQQEAPLHRVNVGKKRLLEQDIKKLFFSNIPTQVKNFRLRIRSKNLVSCFGETKC